MPVCDTELTATGMTARPNEAVERALNPVWDKSRSIEVRCENHISNYLTLLNHEVKIFSNIGSLNRDTKYEINIMMLCQFLRISGMRAIYAPSYLQGSKAVCLHIIHSVRVAGIHPHPLEQMMCCYAVSLLQAQNRLENNIYDYLSFVMRSGVGDIKIVLQKHSHFQKCSDVWQNFAKKANMFGPNLMRAQKTALKIKVLLRCITLLVGEQNLRNVLYKLGKPAIKKVEIHMSKKVKQERDFKNAYLLITRANSIFVDTPKHQFYTLNEKKYKKIEV